MRPARLTGERGALFLLSAYESKTARSFSRSGRPGY